MPLIAAKRGRAVAQPVPRAEELFKMFSQDALARLNDGLSAAAELICADQNCREWIGVHPYHLDQNEYPPTQEINLYPLRYRLIRFRIPRDFDFHTYDLHSEYVDLIREEKVATIENIIDVLWSWDVDPKLLVDPSTCDYPK
jgi:hypothetical protein